MNGKNRSYLLGVVGGYLLYLAYQLFRDRGMEDTTMTPAVRILFIVLFALTGIGLMVFAFRLWKTADRQEKETKESKAPEDRESLK